MGVGRSEGGRMLAPPLAPAAGKGRWERQGVGCPPMSLHREKYMYLYKTFPLRALGSSHKQANFSVQCLHFYPRG